ncbi:MAG: hypothetical protein GX896_00970, partial [Clostridiales bacterium]|nr:hypothetical protein [Clostridiales bacterium]
MTSKAKYIFSFFILFIALFIAGETRAYNASNIVSEAGTHCSYDVDLLEIEDGPEGLSSIINIINNVSKENNVSIFFKHEDGESEIHEINYIYYTNDAKKILLNSLDNKTEYKSFIMGQVDYVFKPMSELQAVRYFSLTFIGSEENISSARAILDDYLSEDYYKEPQENYLNIIVYVIFLAALLAIIMFTIADIEFKKKDYIVQYTLGNSCFGMITRFFLKDIIIYGAIIAFETAIISPLNNIMFMKYQILLLYAAIVVSVLLAYLSLLLAKPIEVLKGKNQAAKTLAVNRGVKILISCLVVSVITLFITFYMSSLKYIKLNDFFLGHKEHSFCNFMSENEADILLSSDVPTNVQIALDYYDQCQPISLNYTYYSYGVKSDADKNGETYCIEANSNALEYIREAIPEISDLKITEDILVIIPPNYSGTTEGFIDNVNGGYEKEKYNTNNVQFFYASENYSIFATASGEFSGFDFVNNIPIFVTTIPENQWDAETVSSQSSRSYLMKIDDKLINEIVEKYDVISYSYTNCYDSYNHYWKIYRTSDLYLGAFSILLIVLEILIISFSVKLEFTLKQEEFCIKKILGYSFLSRYGELIISILLTTLICFFLCAYVMNIFEINLFIAVMVCLG